MAIETTPRILDDVVAVGRISQKMDLKGRFLIRYPIKVTEETIETTTFPMSTARNIVKQGYAAFRATTFRHFWNYLRMKSIGNVLLPPVSLIPANERRALRLLTS